MRWCLFAKEHSYKGPDLPFLGFVPVVRGFRYPEARVGQLAEVCPPCWQCTQTLLFCLMLLPRTLFGVAPGAALATRTNRRFLLVQSPLWTSQATINFLHSYLGQKLKITKVWCLLENMLMSETVWSNYVLCKQEHKPWERDPVPHMSINCLRTSSQPPTQPDHD